MKGSLEVLLCVNLTGRMKALPSLLRRSLKTASQGSTCRTTADESGAERGEEGRDPDLSRSVEGRRDSNENGLALGTFAGTSALHALS